MNVMMKCGEDSMKNKKDRKHIPMPGKALPAVFTAILMAACFAVPVFAAGDGATVIENGFATLLDIVKALVSAIGTIVLLWGLFEWGTSLQSPNGAEQSSAFKRIGGGLVMILAPQLIGLFIS